MNNNCVYIHVIPKTKEVFYVGMGKEYRPYYKYKRSNYWNNIVKKYGYKIIIIEDKLTREEAEIIEMTAIAFFNPRCNFTNGGEGNSGPPHKNTIKSIKNMWKNMNKEEKSNEQRRRASFRKIKKIKCINNGIIYDSAKQAGKELDLPHIIGIRACARGDKPHYRKYKFIYIT